MDLFWFYFPIQYCMTTTQQVNFYCTQTTIRICEKYDYYFMNSRFTRRLEIETDLFR